jgi:hypothetical protein
VTVHCPADRLLAQPSTQFTPTADRDWLAVDFDAARSAPAAQHVASCRQQANPFDRDLAEAVHQRIFRLGGRVGDDHACSTELG